MQISSSYHKNVSAVTKSYILIIYFIYIYIYIYINIFIYLFYFFFYLCIHHGLCPGL